MNLSKLYETRPYLQAAFDEIKKAGITIGEVKIADRKEYRLAHNHHGTHPTGDLFILVGRDQAKDAIQLPIELSPDELGTKAAKFVQDISDPFDFLAVLRCDQHPTWDVVVLEQVATPVATPVISESERQAEDDRSEQRLDSIGVAI